MRGTAVGWRDLYWQGLGTRLGVRTLSWDFCRFAMLGDGHPSELRRDPPVVVEVDARADRGDAKEAARWRGELRRA